MIIQQSGAKIIGRRNRVKVTRKMKIQILHRHKLRHPAACRSALNAKAGAKRRLSKRNDCLFTKFSKRLP